MPRPPYDIVYYDGPSDSLKFDNMTVLVHGTVSRQQLIELAKYLARQHKPEHIGFIDHQEFVSSSPSLGEWRPGDDSGLKEKDWSRHPSREEVALWEEHMQQETPQQDIDENSSIRRVAERHDITEREVADALDEVRSWLSGGTNL